MKLRLLLAAVPALIALALPVTAASPAAAAGTGPARPGVVLVPAGVTRQGSLVITWYHICMHADNTLCEQANGAGNNLTVVKGPGNKWQPIQDGSGGLIEWQNGSGNCMKATNTHDVTVINGACDGGASKDWSVDGTGDVTFYSSYAVGYMGTYGASAGRAVFTDSAHSGFYYGWVAELSGAFLA